MTNKRSGKEAFTFTDRVTGREVLQLTNSDQRSVHGYYDLPPWNRQTGQIAFSSMVSGAQSLKYESAPTCIVQRNPK